MAAKPVRRPQRKPRKKSRERHGDAMPINILMPALSPTMEKGNLAKWLKKEGDKVKAGDIIAEIETDKATMEYEAIDEGVLAKIVVPEGTADVPVNQLIAVLAGGRTGRRDPGAVGRQDPRAVSAGLLRRRAARQHAQDHRAAPGAGEADDPAFLSHGELHHRSPAGGARGHQLDGAQGRGRQ